MAVTSFEFASPWISIFHYVVGGWSHLKVGKKDGLHSSMNVCRICATGVAD